MMKRNLLAVFLIALAVTTHAQKPTDPRLAGLDSIANRILKEWHGAGVGIAVIEKNKVVYAGGFGYRDVENKLPVTANTLFAIGSCTKAFTASVLGMLQKDGRIDIDKPVIIYLPQLKFQNEYTTQHITTKDLMSHRSGLPRHDWSWYGFPSTSRDSLIKRIAFMEPTAELRQIYQYNNFMFLLQGALAEKITGQTWEQNVRDKIFLPLGMKTSNFSVIEMAKSADHSKGYEEFKDSLRKIPYYNIDVMGPAGSINSSASEMSNWLMTWINGGKFNGKELIPPGFVIQAMSSQMVSGAGLPSADAADTHINNYGLAWGIGSYRGHYRAAHGGNIDGFSAQAAFFPSDSIGIVVLSNQNGSAIPGILRNYISDMMLKLPKKDWNTINKVAAFKNKMANAGNKNADSLARKRNTKPSHPLTDYAGTFEHPGYGKLLLTLRNDSLFGYTTNQSFWLSHYHYDVFKPYFFEDGKIDPDDQSRVRLNFQTNSSGSIEAISITALEPAVKELRFTKLPTVVALTKKDLEIYAGEYLLGPQTVTVYIKGEILVVVLPGQPEYELLAAGNHLFNLKALDGYQVKFDVNEKKEATGLSFLQPNGVFKAKRK
ncbi:MAG: serine hydrolase [Gemmatimonadaceae bacterium]|nr:serine hydrolase [Chitinophagaceae bacterium]